MLSPKRERFARLYVQSGNATQSAVEAGYSPRSAKQEGHRLLTFADVKREVAELEREQREAEKVDREYVIRGLRRLAENAESESARVRALELLGKSLRMFTEQIEVHTTHDVSELEQFTTAELQVLLAALQPAVEAEARILD